MKEGLGKVLNRGRQILTIFLFCLVISCGLSLSTAQTVQAASVSRRETVETLQVHLGNASGALVFEPDHLAFVVGTRYKLLLDNPSPTKHYFTAKDFADGVWTQKVQAGRVEIKGAVHELELKPSAEAEWFFIPEKPGVYELHCSIKGHAEAGMRGEITVEIAS